MGNATRAINPYGLMGGPPPGPPDYWPVFVILLVILAASIWIASRHLFPARRNVSLTAGGNVRDQNVLLRLAALSLLVGLFTTLWRMREVYRKMARVGAENCDFFGPVVIESMSYLLAALATSSVMLVLAILLSSRSSDRPSGPRD